MTNPTDILELERFLQENADFERLEGIASRFNPFEAMDWTRQELRHSAFIRWIFDPSESHGLGAYPLRTFLKYVVSRGITGPEAPTVFDVDSWDLTRTTAATEWERIDFFLLNDAERFLVLVENKVDTGEHSNQLARYADRVIKQFPAYKKCLVYLTPEGDQPSDERYIAASHRAIVDLLDLICERRGNQTSEDVVEFIRGYSEMVRRHIVKDSEIEELCQRIYANHRQALDLIFEHRPDRQQYLSNAVEETVSELGGTLDQCSKAYVRWITPNIGRVPALGEGWTRTGRMVLFEVESYAGRIILKLILGPGPEDFRNRVYEAVQGQSIFNKRSSKFYPKWWTFHGHTLFTKKQSESMELEEAESYVRKRLAKFFADEVPAIEKALLSVIGELEAEAETPSS